MFTYSEHSYFADYPKADGYSVTTLPQNGCPDEVLLFGKIARPIFG